MNNNSLPLTHAGNSQLLVINVQERLAKAMPKEDLEQIVPNISRLCQAAGMLDIPIILSEHYGKGLGKTLPEIDQHLPANTVAKDKLTFSCCTAPGFEEELAQYDKRKQIIIVGLEAHICVLQTAAGLQQWGYKPFVVEDAIASRHTHHRINAIKRMRFGGVHVTNAESVAFEWLGDANQPNFKAVSQLFR
jgi:nicotinamidase-related amidase